LEDRGTGNDSKKFRKLKRPPRKSLRIIAKTGAIKTRSTTRAIRPGNIYARATT
jgi:hypothetical protein